MEGFSGLSGYPKMRAWKCLGKAQIMKRRAEATFYEGFVYGYSYIYTVYVEGPMWYNA